MHTPRAIEERVELGPVDEGVPVDDWLTTVCPSNEDGFARILALYGRPGQTIVDPTYGNGRFWKNVDRAAYDVRVSDLAREGVDLRALPYTSESVDMVVLDPPYRYKPARNVPQDTIAGHGKVDGLYNLTTTLRNTAAVIDLYVQGFIEADRVLRRGGFLVVKCQDTVQDGKNLWVHVTLMTEAERLGFACRDLLVVAPSSVLKTRWERQRHLRKGHSYFLVFRKGGHFPFGIPSVERRNGAAWSCSCGRICTTQDELKAPDDLPASGREEA